MVLGPSELWDRILTRVGRTVYPMSPRETRTHTGVRGRVVKMVGRRRDQLRERRRSGGEEGAGKAEERICRAAQGSAQVILGVTMAAGKAWAAVAQDGSDGGQGVAGAEEFSRYPLVHDAPVGGRVALQDAQPMQVSLLQSSEAVEFSVPRLAKLHAAESPAHTLG